MLTIFYHTLYRSWGRILGWGSSLAALGWYVVGIFDAMLEQQESYLELVRGYPPELMSFFGDATAIFTPNGYLTFTFFSYMPPVLGIFAVIVGGGLLAGDEEKGTLDLMLAHPISRTAFFVGQLLAFVAMLLGILALAWLGLVLPIGGTGLRVTGLEMARPFVSLLAVLLFFGALSLMFSQWLPSARASATASGLILIGNYFLTSLGRVNNQLKDWAPLTPLHYYQSGEAVLGLKGEWLALLLASALLFTLIAWWRFQRRDIRVGGEGGWELPGFSWRGPASRAGQS